MNSIEIENKLNQSLDEILFQLSKGNTIEGLKNGRLWMGFEQVKEWKSRFGFQFHIHSNNHLIKYKTHFHIKKLSENIDCRMFFEGTIYDCQGGNQIDKKELRKRLNISFLIQTTRALCLNFGTIKTHRKKCHKIP